MTTWHPSVIVVGFDAMDRTVAAEAVAAGRLPNLARLQEEGTTVAMANPVGMLTGPVWATLSTGVLPDRHNRLNWRVLRPGTYRMEWEGAHSRPACPPFWERLAAQGRSSLVNSVPTVGLVHHPLVSQILDWHTHDRCDPLVSAPPELGQRIRALHGEVGLDTCDVDGATGAHDELLPRLHREVEEFAAGTSQLIDELHPDVVVAVTGVTHCAGHQLWHLHDPASLHARPAQRARLGDALLEVYERADAALGQLLDHAGEETLVAVVLSHGMADNAVLGHLGDPIARAIDAAMGPPPRLHRAYELLRRTPNRLARRALRLAGRPVNPLAHIADGSRRFFPVENFPTHLALRLNIVGREPHGRVHRDEVAQVVDRLEQELLAVCDADTGRPVVQRVIRAAEHYPHLDQSGVADVLVEWTRDALVERVTSPTIGTIERPITETRTGAHRQDGLLVLRGPGMAPGARIDARSVDLWPTVARHLGVEAGDVDGRPVVSGSDAVQSAG